MAPTSATPRAPRSKAPTSQMLTAMAMIGAARASMSASQPGSPARISPRLPPRRMAYRKTSAPSPMASVRGLVCGRPCHSAAAIWGRVPPPAGMPSRWRSCPAAIRIPEAVIKPEMTGWLRKLATKPSRNRPATASIAPDSSASAMAAFCAVASPCAATGAMAEAVISDTTATGPTASTREVPKTA